MKLLRCDVSSFGTLKNFQYEFKDGLNSIKQDNGWGKSTFAIFIKSMFYGLDGDGKRSVADNERTKYRPWNSTDKFGGTIEFEWGNKEFKIERFFGARKVEDSVRLFDIRTGKEFKDKNSTDNLGERIFEIDEDGFLSTTFLSQKDFEIKSNTSLTAKYNEVNNVQDSTLFNKAIEKLSKKANSYKYSGDRGLIPDCKRDLASINEKIELAKRAGEEIVSLKSSIELLRVECVKEKEYLDNLTSRIGKAAEVASKAAMVKAQKKNYEEKIQKRDRLIQQKNEELHHLNGNLPDETVISNLSSCMNALNEVVTKEKILEDDIREIEENKRTKQVEQPKQESSKGGHSRQLVYSFVGSVIVFIISVALIIIGVLIKINTLTIIAAILTGMFFIMSVVLYIFLHKKKIAEPLIQVAEITEDEDTLLSKKKLELIDYRAISTKYKEGISHELDKYGLFNGDNYSIALDKMRQSMSKIEWYTENINELDSQIKDIHTDEVDEQNLNVEDVEELKQEYNRMQDNYNRNYKQYTEKQSAIIQREADADNLADYESRRSEIMENIKTYEEDLDTTKRTLDFLKQADEELKIKYRYPLSNSLNKYITYIAGDIKANIDTDFNVTIIENGIDRETDYYSKGIQSLFGICKRFALTDVLFTKEKPFIMLDDPFCDLDAEKLKQSLALIQQLAKDYQIIYFVCHESRDAQ